MSDRYAYEFDVQPDSIDANGHVNHVEFVRWMQDVAIRHADAVGCTAMTREAGATWFARSLAIEYKRPAFAGDRIRIVTWLDNVRRAFSLRKYEFYRGDETTPLAKGETDWAFLDVQSGRLRSIPQAIQDVFQLEAGKDAGGDADKAPPTEG